MFPVDLGEFIGICVVVAVAMFVIMVVVTVVVIIRAFRHRGELHATENCEDNNKIN